MKRSIGKKFLIGLIAFSVLLAVLLCFALGSIMERETEEKYKHATPVGILKKSKFTEHEFFLRPGDSLFVYTDGVTEAANSRSELFGTDRMLAALNREPDAGCRDTLEHVTEGIQAFVDGAEQFDDITMLCFRYRGRDGSAEDQPTG